MRIPVTTGTLSRLITFIVGGLALAFAVPAIEDPVAKTMQPSVAFFAAGTLLVLLVEASHRRTKLFEHVRLELNKLRRIYHLAKNLSATDPDYRKWFTELHGYLCEYMNGFSGKSLDDYDSFNTSFRLVSYHVYTIPEIESQKTDALYKELLSATAILAEARQQIKDLWSNRLSAYGWIIVLLVSTAFIVTTVLAIGDTLTSRLAGGLAISTMLVALDLLWEADTMATEKHEIADKYAKNVGRLQLGRHKAKVKA